MLTRSRKVSPASACRWVPTGAATEEKDLGKEKITTQAVNLRRPGGGSRCRPRHSARLHLRRKRKPGPEHSRPLLASMRQSAECQKTSATWSNGFGCVVRELRLGCK